MSVVHPASLGEGRYVVGRFLGEGSSKRVYHARDLRLARDVAIALVKLDGLAPEARSSLRREAERSGRLGDHPNIVSIYDVEVEGEVPYIVSEYVPAHSLAEVLDRAPRRRLEREAILAVGAEVSAALAHAHTRGIVHRALKPKRIWLAERGILVGDFGLTTGTVQSRFTEEGRELGAVHYTAPEQLVGKSVDGRADLYALGALLYELACGMPPFRGPGVEAVIAQHLEREPPAPSEIRRELPPELDSLVLKLLAKDPAKRPSSAATVRAALLALANARAPLRHVPGSAPVSSGTTEEALELLDHAFVGRHQELERLKTAFAQASAGAGRVMLVAGQAGIGKTRLADELAAHAKAQNSYVLWGRCHETGGAPAYWPWIQVARAYARSSGLPTADGANPAEEPQTSRAQLFESFAKLLRTAAEERPVLVLLDDLHRADKSSLLVLTEVARRLTDTRLLVLGSYREDEVDDQHPLTEMLTELEGVRSCERLVLDGLSGADVQALLGAGAHGPLDASGAELASAMHRQSDGNPFFIHELVRHLIETRRLAQREGRWTSDVGAITELGIPEGVRDVVGQRLTRRSAECLRVLTAAAVIGREFPAGALPPVAGLEPEQVGRALNEALSARIIRPLRGPPRRYIFSHTLIRETLYSDISQTRRARLHRTVGEALEMLYRDDLSRHLSELAHHFAEAAAAGDPAKAVEYGTRAGRQAMGQFAYEAAAGHLRRTLRVLDRAEADDVDTRGEVLLELGDAEWSSGEFERSREAFRAAVDVAREVKSSDRFARAALGYGGRMGFGAGARDDTLIALLEEALAEVRISDPASRARLTGRLAEALSFAAPLERRRELIHEATTTAEQTGDPRVLAYVLSNAHWALWTPDNLSQRLDMANQIIRLARAAGDHDLEFDGLHWRVSDLMELGAVVEAEHEVTTWSQRAQEHRRLYPQWLVAVFRAMRRLEQGQLEEGERLALEALEIGQRGHNENALQLLGVQLATVRREQGRYRELEPGLLAFVEQYPAIPAWRCALALMFSESGRATEARAEFDRLASNQFEQVTRDMFWLPAMAILAQTCVNLGDAERARELYELLAPFRDRNMMLGTVATSWGSTARTLGALAATMSQLDTAAADYEYALEQNSRFRANVWLAHTQLEYAALLSARNRSGDRTRAAALEAQALEAAERLQLTRLFEREVALRVGT